MADQFLFNRDTKMYVRKGSDIWEVPVLDGFSFSQAQNLSEITLNEASSGTSSRRGRQAFVDSLAPAEFSFSTYMRPLVATNGATGGWEASGSENAHHAVEEALWAMMVGETAFVASAGATEAEWTPADGVESSTSNMTVTFVNSDTSSLGSGYSIYFVLGAATGSTGKMQNYQLTNAVINEATIDFDIEGIATIQWSGFADTIVDNGQSSVTPTIYEGVSSTDKLSTVAITPATLNSGSAYNLTLTGGSITISNNMTYLTPETLGTINKPFGNVTGTRSVTGNLTCYLNVESDASADLFEDIIESNNGVGTDVVTNDFNVVITIGGSSAPKVGITMAQCHLEIPTHSFDDITSVDVAFHALPANLNPGSTAASYEISSIVYTGS